VTESAAGAARFDHLHLLRQNCRTQRRRKRASHLRNFERHLSEKEKSLDVHTRHESQMNAAFEDGYRKLRPA
jgi:predicted secreted protein